MLGSLKRRLWLTWAIWMGWLKVEDAPAARVYDYRRYSRKSTKTALLSYLPNFVIEQAEGKRTQQFSNVGLAITLPRVLNQLGYEVDIINWTDTDFRPIKQYDLFIGHGAKNFNIIYDSFKIKPLTVYFSTGSYWKFHNEQEDRRLAEFKSRNNGAGLPRDRYIYESEEYANDQADAIVCLGNEDTRLTYKKYPRVFNLPIASYPDPRSIPFLTEARRKSWLFYSGGGNIHKGLDLVLEAFEGEDFELYICTLLDEEFERFYHKLLFESPNIHYIGLVSPRSERYYEVMDSCAFSILPSCSEGSPGSVVESMQRGLIPVVSRESHIDIDDFGWMLEKTDVKSIKSLIAKTKLLPLDELSKKSRAARRAAEEYLVPKFEEKLAAILTEITAELT